MKLENSYGGEGKAIRDVDVLHSKPIEGQSYRRLINEYEVFQPDETWTLAWLGQSEMLLNERWVTTGESEAFSSRYEAVLWLSEPLPTWH